MIHIEQSPMASDKTSGLLFWGFLHFLTDAVSVYILFSTLSRFHVPAPASFAYILAYNSLAFALELPLGLAADRFRSYRTFIMLSLVIQTAACVLAGRLALIPIVLTGIANALFHTGAGSMILALYPKTAAHIGLFIAPGTLGVMLGGMLAPQIRSVIPFALILLFCIPVEKAIRIPVPDLPAARTDAGQPVFPAYAGMLLLVILFRSLSGSSLVFPWNKGPLFIALSAAAAFAGKSAGGIAADRWGYATTGIGSLLFSIPFILAGAAAPAAGITGMILFQMTTAVTAGFLYRLMPDRPGFSFGLSTLMLFFGSLPFPNPAANATNLFPSAVNALAAVVFGIAVLAYLRCTPQAARDRMRI